MTKIFIGILIILFVIGCVVIASSNIATKINSTRGIEAIAGSLDQDGNVSIEQYSGGVKWVKLDNINKQIQLYDDTGALLTYIGQGTYTISTQVMKIKTNAGTNDTALAIYGAGAKAQFYVNGSGYVHSNNTFHTDIGFIADPGGTLGHKYYYTGISNEYSGQPVYITDTEGLQINALAGTGNAFVCVDANGKLYRSATACL